MSEQERGQNSFKVMLGQLVLVMMGLAALVLLLVIVGGISDKYYTNRLDSRSVELDRQDAFAQGYTYEEYLQHKAEEQDETGEEMPLSQDSSPPVEQTAVADAGASMAAVDGWQPLTVPGQMILEGPTAGVTQAEMDYMSTKAAVIHTTMGDMPMEFNVEKAPVCVKNFLYLSENGYYDGQSFYRTYPGAYIVTGSPSGRRGGTPGYWLDREYNNLVAMRGAVVYLPCLNEDKMAGEIAVFMADGPGFAQETTVFGRLTDRVDVVEKCADAPVVQDGYLTDRVYITSIEIIDKADLPNQ